MFWPLETRAIDTSKHIQKKMFFWVFWFLEIDGALLGVAVVYTFSVGHLYFALGPGPKRPPGHGSTLSEACAGVFLLAIHTKIYSGQPWVRLYGSPLRSTGVCN